MTQTERRTPGWGFFSVRMANQKRQARFERNLNFLRRMALDGNEKAALKVVKIEQRMYLRGKALAAASQKARATKPKQKYPMLYGREIPVDAGTFDALLMLRDMGNFDMLRAVYRNRIQRLMWDEERRWIVDWVTKEGKPA